jgi:uncharacterized membrane protein SpoIIM required for sporulation
MKNAAYFEKAQPVWDELSALLDKAKRVGARGLSAEELARLDRLYRLSTIHLAQVRLRTTNQALVERLNRLVARAHSFIYVAPRQNPLSRFAHFYAVGFARAVARTWRFHMVSFLLFAAGALLAYWGARNDHITAYALLGDDIRLPGASAEQLQNVLRSNREWTGTEKFQFASMLLTHNTKVGFSAFALGIFCGIPTVFLMLMNGGLLGAFAAVHHARGVETEMWAWILVHGVTELTAIILCGGAGFMLGMAVLRPRYATRAQSLLIAGREALRIALGVVPMFILAGIIESYVRQSQLPVTARLIFACATAIFWASYFRMGAYLESRDREDLLPTMPKDL